MRWALLALLAALALPAPAAAQRTISLSGSTSALPLVADLAYFYGREHRRAPRFDLVGGGTMAGLTDTKRRIVDGGMISRALRPDDPPGLVLTPFALSAVCLVTNADNPVPGVGRAQMQDLLAGRLTHWSQVPGSPRTDAIIPVTYAPGAGARTVFDSVFVDAATLIAYAPRVFRTAVQVRDFVRATPAAWGYVDAAFRRGLHTMRYEGVPCTRATVAGGAYPASRPFGIVTRGRPRGELARFLRWVRTSRKAKKVIATRYIPLSRSGQ